MLANQHIFSISMAALTILVLSFFITLPFFIYQYRKHGFMSKFRIFIFFIFIFYCTSAFYLTLLPLPENTNNVEYLGRIKPQLIPFNAMLEIIQDYNKLLSKGVSWYLLILKNNAFWQVLFNFILLLPLGFFLRYYLKFKKNTIYAISFLVALFFEVTQLTGLYGIYKYPYRLFDVDDLILNTSGAILGYHMAPLLYILLPNMDKIDENYNYDKPVSYTRKFISFYIDICIVNYIAKILSNNTNIKESISQLIVFAIYFIIIQYLTKGFTLGKKLLKIKVVSETHINLTFSELFIRYLLLLMFPIIISILSDPSVLEIFKSQIIILFGIVFIIFLVLLGISVFRKDKRIYIDLFSKTYIKDVYKTKA